MKAAKIIVNVIVLTFCLICFGNARAQKGTRLPEVDLSFAIGASQGTAAIGWWNHWFTGHKKRLALGAGVRLTAYKGNHKDFVTAPASISRGSSVPFLVVFSAQKTENWDTLTVSDPFVAAANIAVSGYYHLSPKLSAGFNIDLLGFSFGNSSHADFRADGEIENTRAKPANFNVLLTGDLDIGNLNSEFYLAYKIGDRIAVKGLYQFNFVEYSTPVELQQNPQPNDRFRNKANLVGLGIKYQL